MSTATRKFLHCLAFFILDGLGFCFSQAQPTYDHRLVGGTCNLDQCLFIDQAAEENGLVSYFTGTARVIGYYADVSRETNSGGTQLCPALTIERAPPFFQSALQTHVQEGNTVNRVGATGELIVALDFNTLSATEIETITASTPQHPIRLTLFKATPTEQGLPECGSLVHILRVERARN